MSNRLNILFVGDLLIKSSTCTKELARIARRYNANFKNIDWELESLEELREFNLRIEKEGPGSVDMPNHIFEFIKDTDILIVQFCPVSEQLLKSAPRLKVVATMRTGLSNIDVQAAEQRGIEVVNLPGRLSDAVSDLAVGLILCVIRGIVWFHEALRYNNAYQDFGKNDLFFEISGRTVGLIGFGDIAKKVAHKLTNFDVNLTSYDPYVPDGEMTSRGVRKAQLRDLLSQSDVVSIHTVLNDSTRGLIGNKELMCMKPTAFLINTARAEIVDKEALFNALQQKKIAGAALDVFWEEPIDTEDPFIKLDNVIVTPHLGGTLKDTLCKSIVKLNKRLTPIYEKYSARMKTPE